MLKIFKTAEGFPLCPRREQAPALRHFLRSHSFAALLRFAFAPCRLLLFCSKPDRIRRTRSTSLFGGFFGLQIGYFVVC